MHALCRTGLGEICFCVSDTACSMPYKAQAAEKQGAGLGLALGAGEGTTVRVHLPTAMTLSIAAE
jgi:hypothetical protein